MNISSLYKYGMSSIFSTTSVNQTNNTRNTSSENDQTSETAGLGGDSFEFSPPPMSFMSYNRDGSISGTSNIRSDINSFLEKVKNGTATDTDLQNIQAELEEFTSAQSNTSSGVQNTSGTTDIPANIGSFLDAVKNGTVTDADLKKMQTKLQQEPFSQNGSTNGGDLQADIQNFLNSIKNGTATDADLYKMQTELQQTNSLQSMNAQGQYGRGQGSNIGSDIRDFLTSVKNGSVTDADIQKIQTELQQSGEEQGSDTGNQNAGYSLQADLLSFLEAVKNGSVTDADIQKMQTELNQFNI